MARKIKKLRTVPAAGRGPAPAEPAQQPERVEKCGHMDQPLLMLTMLLLGLTIKEAMFLFRGPNRLTP